MKDIVEPQSHQDLKLSAEQVGRRLLEGGEGAFVSDVELARAFGVTQHDVMFAFGKMKLKEFLKRHDVFLVRTRNPNGYRYATDAELVNVVGPQKLDAMRNALSAAEHVAAATDVTRLEAEDRRKLEHARGYTAMIRQSVMSARKKFAVHQIEAAAPQEDESE